MEPVYCAIDLGAESGRIVLGRLKKNRSVLEICEVYRFPNRMININGHLHWDVHRIFHEIKKGLEAVAGYTDSPISSLGVDTWGVDFGLLDHRGSLMGLPYTYRDKRTQGAIHDFNLRMPLRDLYDSTGIQVLPINTLFQLYAMFKEKSSILEAANELLFIPDIFNYFLTGMKCTEFTYATTSQLFNPLLNDWDDRIIRHAGIKRSLFKSVLKPGTHLCTMKPELEKDTGMNRPPVVLVASHDTASAVAAVPALDCDYVYISCGTWSLMGVEELKPIINDVSFKNNFTNEGGVCGTYRVLKNITGLWLLQECRKKWSNDVSQTYEDLVAKAHAAPAFRTILNPDDPVFFNPDDMPAAIREFCLNTDQPLPDTTGHFVRCILESLALSYARTLEIIRSLAHRNIKRVHIIGGGSQNSLLCQFTADATGLPVHAGPVETTAIGNLMVQAMAAEEVRSLRELREIVANSFPPRLYEPTGHQKWVEPFGRFKEICSPD